MRLITAETSGRANATLKSVWEDGETFAVVSARSGVANSWITMQLDGLPGGLETGHFVLLTSGTTGHPKLVVGQRERAKHLVSVLHELQECEPVRETIVTLPLTYCYAFVNQWLWAHVYGRRLLCTNGLARPGELRATLEGADRSMLCLVGAQVPLLLEYFQKSVFPGVIRVHFAGGRFPQEHLTGLRRMFPEAAVFNNYGCAEAMPRLSLRRAEQAVTAQHIGWPLPGVELRTDEEGRLLFRSRYGAVAVLEKTSWALVTPSDWVPTGDLGVLGDDGHWELAGRYGEVFKRHGEKVSLARILPAIRDHWRGEAEYFRTNDGSGEPGYILVLAPEPTATEVRQLLKEIGARFVRSQWPLAVVSVGVIPLLVNGKVDRQQLASGSFRKTHWTQHLL